LRMYEMFLGPLTDHKPWDTNGIEGVFRFMRKLWRLFHDEQNMLAVTDTDPSQQEYKVLHRTIRKIREDIERFSFNTAVSGFMICVNELTDLRCRKRAILEPLTILISPFAPHMAEELWSVLGHQESVTTQPYPEYDENLLQENSYEYPVSFYGKLRFKMVLPLDMTAKEMETQVLSDPNAARWLEGVSVRKIVIVPGKIINVVVG